MKKRNRRLKSIGTELVRKSREAALAAVQIYNNPTIQFKSELFIVTMNIAWTYLLHAYFRRNSVDYRYHKMTGQRRNFYRTKSGSYKYWELERCLNDPNCPLDASTISNLQFLIGIRHEIEHQMTGRIDDTLSAKFQASCLNFNSYLRSLFGDKLGIEKYLSFSLQFSSISADQIEVLSNSQMPKEIQSYISQFEANLPDGQFQDSRYAYRVFFLEKTANRKNQADRVIEFVKGDSEFARTANAEYERVVLKEIDKNKYRATDIVKTMKSEGYPKFSIHFHTNIWKQINAKEPKKGYAGSIGEQWYWYESWLTVVRDYCHKNKDKFT